MKMISTFVLCVFMVSAIAQENKNANILMIGDKAPAFQAETTTGTINFPADYGSSWKVIFSHPRDFTPVCSSEVLELGYLQQDFEDLNAKIVVVSTDTKERHLMWQAALENTPYRNNTRVKLNFPLVDDSKRNISKAYGMLHNKVSTTENVRGVFVIDPDNVVRATIFYPMDIGRNLNEVKRSLIALQTADRKKLLTPANWEKGDDLLVPHFPYTDAEVAENPEIVNSYYQVGNLMWFKKAE
jgi:peroxiredoxin 2/4